MGLNKACCSHFIGFTVLFNGRKTLVNLLYFGGRLSIYSAHDECVQWVYSPVDTFHMTDPRINFLSFAKPAISIDLQFLQTNEWMNIKSEHENVVKSSLQTQNVSIFPMPHSHVHRSFLIIQMWCFFSCSFEFWLKCDCCSRFYFNLSLATFMTSNSFSCSLINQWHRWIYEISLVKLIQ